MVDASRLNPELRAKFRFTPNPPIGTAWQRRLVRKLMGAIPAAKIPEGMTFESFSFPAGGSIRVFTPASGGNGAVLLFIHGGGMVIGNATQEDRRLVQIAQDLDIVAVSVEYRLAPEHPFPTPLDDCFEAWQWVQEHAAERGIDPARVVVGGQSAGGGLAAGLALRVHDELAVQPLGQLLFCPMLDDRTAANRTLDEVKHFLWNNRSNRVGWSAYLAQAPGGAEVSDYAAPSRRTNLEGLPPAWIGTGDIELFFAENVAYAETLSSAGVDTTLEIAPGAPHAFESVAGNTAIAQKYSASALTWLKNRVTTMN